MINKIDYKQAYLELYKIIDKLPLKDKEKIPEDFIEFLKDNMDTNYSFHYDDTKSLLEQKIKVETKALLVQLYEKYLSSPNEKEFWEQYDINCLRMNEQNKTNDNNDNSHKNGNDN